jgi:outer membrane protein TolC
MNTPRLRTPATLSWRLLASATFTSMLAGCAVGPDFKRPAAPAVSAYTAAPLPAQTASSDTDLGGGQRFITGANVEAQWWRKLGSPKLDALIEQAFLASPTLSSAQATLHQAQETYASQAGSTLYPQVDAGLGAWAVETNRPNLRTSDPPWLRFTTRQQAG